MLIGLFLARAPVVPAAAEEAREAIPFGGDSRLDPGRPGFVAAGHGGRILLSRDDGGENWEEVHAYEEPESEHIHGAQGLRDIAFGHVTEAGPEGGFAAWTRRGGFRR